ncbi:hypothetical protein GGR50DRAFT_366924 [Xylaria sp. CBS 124048]|nr:hypothetical protein GGR50DRAFT_366924 [Xylaria sp. CBS 124048]
MAHHAWLDSLSEDWVSQSESETSQLQIPTFSSPSPPASTSSKNVRSRASFIPRPNTGSSGAKRPQNHLNNSSNNSSPSVLSERNPNHPSMKSAHLGPSKLSQETKPSHRGPPTRSISTSTAGSVVHHSVLRNKTRSASPCKDPEEVPEWRRRLIHGELDYGEPRDLFSSAAIGLENMFRPPQSPERQNGESCMHETTLPSSPPPYSGTSRDSVDGADTPEHARYDLPVQRNPAFPRPIFFRSTENDRTTLPSDGPITTQHQEYDHSEAEMNGTAEHSMSFQTKQLLDESRKTSGQSDFRNEDFSPILIARHSSEGGGVSFAPELPANLLHKKLEILQRDLTIAESEADDESSRRMTVNSRAREFETTQEYAKNGGFLNLRRGGRSTDGSFRQRPLSPATNMDTSEMLPESSLQASTPKQFHTTRTDRFSSTADSRAPATPPSPSLPRVPHPSPEKRPLPVSPKAASPLKLFGPYDTFTNQTLLRRISQFEDPQSHPPPYSAGETAVPPMPPAHAETLRYDGVSGSPNPAARRASRIDPDHYEAPNVVNTFGAGELDDYEFEGDISLCSSISIRSEEEKENVTPSPSRSPSANFVAFDIHEDLSSEEAPSSVRPHQPTIDGLVPSIHRVRESKSLEGLRSKYTSSSLHPSIFNRNALEAKRPRTSPSKDPTPKRRRTLHRSDIAYGLEDRRAVEDTIVSSHYTIQSAVSKDRKPIRRVELQKLAGREIPFAHHSLIPISPTPNRRTSEWRDRAPLAELGFNLVPKSATTFAPQENTANPSTSSSRKVSMKTQDFYDAAEEVMAMIRNKARPVTGLASVEESESESPDGPTQNESAVTQDSFQESTREPFSRPPSRDGRPVHRIPARQEDPELADQLKKYAENSDPIDMLSQSTRSIGKPNINDKRSHSTGSAGKREYTSEKLGHVHEANDVTGDNTNARVSHNAEHTKAGSNAAGFHSHNSQSSGSATECSIPTISSRGSDSRRLIGPDVVAQLIGNQVGNMVFDDVNKMWQKIKKTKPPMSILPSEDSEDDPFASIPDLTVDSTKEKQSLDLTATKDRSDLDERQSNHTSAKSSVSGTGSITAETPITSERLGHKTHQAHVETAVEDDKEIEHEMSLHEDRMHKTTPPRRRNLTITFSSPIASIIQDAAHSDLNDSSYEEEFTLEHSFGSSASDSVRERHVKAEVSPTNVVAQSSQSRVSGESGSLSNEGRAFIPRPVSRTDEQGENASDRQTTEQEGQKWQSKPTGNPDLTIVMATPDAPRTTAVLATPLIGQYVGTLSLTPLSDFTVHQVDASCALEVSYVIGDKYLVTGDGSKKIMSKAVRTLVEKITEIEPFEPDWETLPKLDLSGKKLDTLHMLDEFCSTLVTLNASNNGFTHLDGVPRSVRNLRMTHNVLSEITAWGRLINLQYVDVSNNQIQSLAAFQDLVHLRSLRADNNQITSLDGIQFHDGLQILRARGNQIMHIDFDGTKMHRLTELDLENNQITTFKNSEQLTCLSTLNLQHNCLTSFAPSEGRSASSLRFLKLSGNDLETLNIAAFPSLRLLHADRNRFTKITGFSQCRRLDSLSLREQKGAEIFDTSFLDSACEVRKLFLSGNRLSGFNPQVDFLNLQYLELANCGLQSLAPNIGYLVPNLRMLNINFNAIDDLSPLRFIPRLRKLLAAGNRLADVGKTTSTLAEFPHLSRLDLRNNGATLGFYTPVQTVVPSEDSSMEAEFNVFEIPDMDVLRHEKFASRLDIDTRMRKRIYDMIVLGNCKQLKMLDGLPVSKETLSKKDDVWGALVENGIIESCVKKEDAEEDESTL